VFRGSWFGGWLLQTLFRLLSSLLPNFTVFLKFCQSQKALKKVCWFFSKNQQKKVSKN
jgi:hypothetical protein